MTIDPSLAFASFAIGIVVGLTGMGGGALMTPALVLFFNVAPLRAVSSAAPPTQQGSGWKQLI